MKVIRCSLMTNAKVGPAPAADWLHVEKTNMRARGLIFFFFHLSVPPFAVFGLGGYFLFP